MALAEIQHGPSEEAVLVPSSMWCSVAKAWLMAAYVFNSHGKSLMSLITTSLEEKGRKMWKKERRRKQNHGHGSCGSELEAGGLGRGGGRQALCVCVVGGGVVAVSHSVSPSPLFRLSCSMSVIMAAEKYVAACIHSFIS